MRISNVYSAVADANANDNHDPTTNPDPILTLSLTLSLIVNLSLALPILRLLSCTTVIFRRGYGMNAVLLINAISTRLQRACVKRRSVGWWVWPLVLSSHNDQP